VVLIAEKAPTGCESAGAFWLITFAHYLKK
jgi:hypothetical protein